MRIIVLIFCTLITFSCKQEKVNAVKNNDAVKNNEVPTTNEEITLPPDSTAIISNNDAGSQTSEKFTVFNYEDELCRYKGYYNSEKISEKQLEGALKLWRNSPTSLSSPAVYYLNNLNKIRLEKDHYLQELDKEYRKNKASLEKLEIPSDSYWQKVRSTDLHTLNSVYKYYSVIIKAYSDPSVLKQTEFSEKCQKYVLALNSDEATMRKIWEEKVTESAKRNGDPERVWNEYQSQKISPDFADYAMIDLITFGWGNCANAQIIRIPRDLKMIKEFEQLFEKTETIGCDEP